MRHNRRVRFFETRCTMTTLSAVDTTSEKSTLSSVSVQYGSRLPENLVAFAKTPSRIWHKLVTAFLKMYNSLSALHVSAAHFEGRTTRVFTTYF